MRKTFAVILVSVLAFSALSATTTATHEGEGGQLVADGFATLVSGENAIEQDNTLVMSPEDGGYVLEMELRDDAGNKVDFDSLGWAVFTVDQASSDDFNMSNATDTSEYAEAVGTADNVDDDHKATFRIPTSAVSFGAAVPEDGVAIYAWAQDKDTNGGAVSLAADQHAKSGNWQEADEADQQFTPVFLVNADSDDLVEPNNPVYNPDFSVGETTGQEVTSPVKDSSSGEAVAAPTAAPPWAAHVSNKTGQFPASSTQLEAVDGGHALQVNVAPQDLENDSRLHVVQQFGDATELFPGRQSEGPMPLKWQDPQEYKVDARLPTDQSVSEVELTLTVEWASDNSTDGAPRITETKAVTLQAGDSFETFTIDFEDDDAFDSHENKTLSRVWVGVDTSAAPSDSFQVDIDNARLNGAELDPATFEDTAVTGDSLADSSITDGHAVHIKPVDPVTTDRDRNAVSVDPFETVEDRRYLFEVTVWDTKEDKKVDPANFDADSFQVGRADPLTGNTSTSGGQFEFVDAYETGLDYANDDARLVVVNASDVSDGALTSAWYYASIDDGTPPQDAAGYYSVLKNEFEGFAAADQLDWAANPVEFANGTAGTFQHESFIQDLDVNDTAQTTTITVASESPVAESLDVKILDRDGNVTASGTTDPVAVTEPDTITLDAAVQDTGSIQVEAGEVTKGSLLELGPPQVSIDTSPFTDSLTDGDEIDLRPGTYVDPDVNPGIVSAEWTVTVQTGTENITETISATDDDGDGNITAAEAAIEGYQFPDAGTANVTLAIEDNDGESASAKVSNIDVDNAAPEFGDNPLSVLANEGELIESDPANSTWTAKAGAEVAIRSTAFDPSPNSGVTGSVNIRAQDVGELTGTELELTLTDLNEVYEIFSPGALVYATPSPGDYTIDVTWDDGEGGTTSVTGLLKARQPQVSVSEENLTAVSDGEAAGSTPLVGEDLEASVAVDYTGDRPADAETETLELLAPNGSVVASTNATDYDTDAGVFTKSMVATYSLSADVTEPGNYTLRLAGDTFNGVALDSVYNETLDVRESQAPAVDLDFPDIDLAPDGKHYTEIGQAVDVESNATDPDCADDGPRCQLSYSWSVASGAGSVSADGASSTFTASAASPSKSSPHEIQVTVTDHLGETATTTIPIVVDDRLEFANLDVEADWATTLDGDTTASGTVVDDIGAPVDAILSYELRYSPNKALYDAGVRRIVDQGQQQLDSSGQFQVDFDDETAGLTKPGYYEASFTAQEPVGRLDRADQAPDSGGGGPNSTTYEETVTAIEPAFVESGTQTSFRAEGACYYEDQGAEDGLHADESGVDTPSSSNVQEGVAACSTAATNASTPGGGSYGRITVGAFSNEASVGTVPVTDVLTGALPLP
jgi:hypothetical protein